MTGAATASSNNKRGLGSVFMHELPLERQFSFSGNHRNPPGRVRECQNVILS
jgi:hypothetical protein